MPIKGNELIQSFTRGLSSSLIIFWIIGIIVLFNFDKRFMIGLMLWIVVVLATVISWKDEVVGGGIFLVMGLFYFLVYPVTGLSSFGSSPFFVIGGLSMLHHYLERRDLGPDDF